MLLERAVAGRNGRGRPFSANKLRQRQVASVLDALGVARGGFHGMRRRATRSLLANATPAVVQVQLRHSDAQITARNLRPRGRRCAEQRGSESLDKVV